MSLYTSIRLFKPNCFISRLIILDFCEKMKPKRVLLSSDVTQSGSMPLKMIVAINISKTGNDRNLFNVKVAQNK